MLDIILILLFAFVVCIVSTVLGLYLYAWIEKKEPPTIRERIKNLGQKSQFIEPVSAQEKFKQANNVGDLLE